MDRLAHGEHVYRTKVVDQVSWFQAEAGLSLALIRRSRSGMEHRVTWQRADVLTEVLPEAAFALWHDRAVFHFLTGADDRALYVAQVRRALRPGGFVLVATFAEDGPTHCSGLDVVRYEPDALHQQFGSDFQIVDSVREEHITPWSTRQAFTYCLFRDARVSPGSR